MGKRVRQKQCEFGVSVYTGTLAIPTLALLSSTAVTVTVAPLTTNAEALAAGDVLSWCVASADLPAGLVITNVRATGATSVRVQLAALISLGAGNVTLSVVKLRG